jgi:hypothetical protein
MPILAILFGAYLLAVVYHGNLNALGTQSMSDLKSGGKWIAAVVVLLMIYKFSPDTVKPLIKAFLILAGIGYIIVSYQPLSTNIKQVYSAL